MGFLRFEGCEGLRVGVLYSEPGGPRSGAPHVRLHWTGHGFRMGVIKYHESVHGDRHECPKFPKEEARAELHHEMSMNQVSSLTAASNKARNLILRRLLLYSAASLGSADHPQVDMLGLTWHVNLITAAERRGNNIKRLRNFTCKPRRGCRICAIFADRNYDELDMSSAVSLVWADFTQV